MASGSSVRPVETLRELVTSLEAALTVVAAKPKPKPVHHLRTITRRIEAQIELLAMLSGAEKKRKATEEPVELLGKLRKAAGRVRDIDVQRKLIKSGTGSQSKEARQLRKILKQHRHKEEARLLNTLEEHRSKLAKALEVLVEAKEAAKPAPFAVAKLADLVCDWYTHNSPAVSQSAEQMHEIRKAAKMSRYMAESISEDSKLAQIFEEIQQAGGRWHDWLMLNQIACEELGDSSTLAKLFAQRCERSMAEYKRYLKSLPQKLAHVTG
ncbi:MAG TPA: CHAD domain-containing protein [Edaphobacter sp.]|nr:CHAD domain-containing protein [Edaphobacter sp.]